MKPQSNLKSGFRVSKVLLPQDINQAMLSNSSLIETLHSRWLPLLLFQGNILAKLFQLLSPLSAGKAGLMCFSLFQPLSSFLVVGKQIFVNLFPMPLLVLFHTALHSQLRASKGVN